MRVLNHYVQYLIGRELERTIVMPKQIAIGIQSFEELIKGECYYVDKTNFIKEWWDNKDSVTLITRPRRFGKTLNMNMIETFFSVNYAGRGDLFEGLSIWEEEKFRQLQGTYPVIFLSFANIKENNYKETSKRICELLKTEFQKNEYIMESDKISESEKLYIKKMINEVSEFDAGMALNRLSYLLSKYHGLKTIIILDEYDTPMQEAYINGYWDELMVFFRSLFNSTFKTNPYLERGLMTGITRISKESIFSDLNNLEVVTTTSDKYATSFGFTEEEVFHALDEFNLGNEKEQVKEWYDGFVFGSIKDMYNPWSILNFLEKVKYDTYWANTSSNALVGKLIRQGSKKVKTTLETLLKDEMVQCPLDEQIVFNQLDTSEGAIWSLLIASGYLKVLGKEKMNEMVRAGYPMYDLMITNLEVKKMFLTMINGWFHTTDDSYGEFVNALLKNDLEAMNEYMNEITMEIFSYFDTTAKSMRSASERFYHGFVLGLLAELKGRYTITSNRESGLGRYDVMLEPKDFSDNAIIIEFKVFNEKKENSLEETVEAALKQIEEKQYEAALTAKGIPTEKIYKYGFAFEGKKVLIDAGECK